ncbi:MAG: family 20 glycosylhydrolase [Mucilaginibacter polytrichastri]|nr:family 20 glycosylhydrolase [Mucilaginibacter polytrichastri]
MKKTLFSAILFLLATVASAQDLSLLPYPKSVHTGKGKFVLNPSTPLIFPEKYRNEAMQLQMMLREAGVETKVRTGKPAPGAVVLADDAGIKNPEGYALNVSAGGTRIAASTPAGMFRGMSTFIQLLPFSPGKITSATIPAVVIQDEPQYAWRGMMLDVSRHFFSMHYVMGFIDRMAMYKFNKLHLHLTDDQGWRIEIKKYPKLTEEGAWRTFDRNDSACMKKAETNPDFRIDEEHIREQNGQKQYGGFYTQQQIREIVAYAAKKHIEVIPEIDMPGHMMAAIKAYPGLTCTEAGWGKLFSVPICPCEESVYTFTQDIFREIFALFPSKYVHIGGDEVDRETWAKSTACQALMKKENIRSLEELQSYFIHRMEKFFNANGKTLMGWDEIIEGGVTPTATIMYWRGWVPKAPYTAAKNGNPVVITNNNIFYFDYPEDKNSLANIYNTQLVPEGLTPEEGRRIIGAQANVWSEQIPSEKRMDFLTATRMLAVAEKTWGRYSASYAGFTRNFYAQLPKLEKLKVNFRLPDLIGVVEENVFVDKAVFTLENPVPGARIHYTTDGTFPTLQSPVLPENYAVTQPVKLRITAFTPGGMHGEVYNVNFRKEEYATPVKMSSEKGLKVDYYKGGFKNTKEMLAKKADSSFVSALIASPKSITAPAFGLKFSGQISVPETGIYSFFYLVDDGGILKIADRLVVDNDGNHAPFEKSGQVALQKGAHPFALDFVEGGGGFTLKLAYSKDGSAPQPVPESWFSH